jgi:hypothetical protein
MDGSLFDRWTKSLEAGMSWRTAIKTLSRAGLAADVARLSGLSAIEKAEAVCLPGENCQCRKTGKTCTRDAKCCSKLCVRGKCVCRDNGQGCQKHANCCAGATCQQGTCTPPTDYVFDDQWGSFGSGKGEFDEPGRIALDASGRVFVTDGFNDRVQTFTAGGTFLETWG